MGCCGAADKPAVERTPLPRGPLAAVILINMTAGFQMNIIFPFVPFMVEELRQTTVDTGFYVGLLAASYFAGQFVASFIWPPLSDMLGRKKMLLLGQLGLTIPFVIFGSASNYWVALFFRMLNGLCQQNWVITNAMLADITDSTNQAQGMAAGAFSWGLANILAPMVGGLLARPTVTLGPEYGFEEDGIFGAMPYLLPTLLVCIWGWTAALIGIVWLPPDELSWSQAWAKLMTMGRGGDDGSSDYAALSTTDDDADGGGNRTPNDCSRKETETELQSYIRILKER
jgi:MFS family permease